MEQSTPPAGRSRAITDFDGKKLKQWRTEVLMVSQVELGDLAQLSRGEISHLETAKRKPLAKTLRQLCAALGCNAEDLLTRASPAPETRDNHAATQHHRTPAALSA